MTRMTVIYFPEPGVLMFLDFDLWATHGLFQVPILTGLRVLNLKRILGEAG